MTTRKRNEYLDADLSDDEASSGYDSDAAQKTKGKTTKTTSAKRRKLDPSASEAESDFSGLDSDPEPTKTARSSLAQTTSLEESPPPQPDPKAAKSLKSLESRTTSTNPQKPTSKPGVIYLSSLPPYMPPRLVRHLLAPHGTITNLFLTPEPPSLKARRKKLGGNTKRKYTDGWVEFSRRKDAKRCAEAINGATVGGKKGGWYRDDVWNVRYLRGFGWGDLMEGVRREEREREERVRVGVRREGRERGAFLEGVDRAKMEDGKRKKREAKESRDSKEGERALVKKPELSGAEKVEGGAIDGKSKERFERRFRQNEVMGTSKAKKPKQSEDVKRVLSKIF